MDQREELGDALDLVDDDRAPAGVGGDELLQPFRSRVVVALGFRIEEIDPRCIRIAVPQPCGLASAARPEQEVAAGRMVEKSRHILHIGSK